MTCTTKLLIKGMVCERCIRTIRSELERLSFDVLAVELGEITLSGNLSSQQIALVESKLKPMGFNLLEDRRQKILQDVRSLVQQVYSGDYDFPLRFRFSDLVKDIDGNYDYVSGVFASAEQKTLERHIVEYRVEKVKEMLVYSGLSLVDIAFRLNYSSVAHLSAQFKKITGMTVTAFRSLIDSRSPDFTTAD